MPAVEPFEYFEIRSNVEFINKLAEKFLLIDLNQGHYREEVTYYHRAALMEWLSQSKSKTKKQILEEVEYRWGGGRETPRSGFPQKQVIDGYWEEKP